MKDVLLKIVGAVWDYFLCPISLCATPLCIPSLLHELGFATPADVVLAALLVINGLLFIYNCIHLRVALYEENATLMTRCWVIFVGLIGGTIVGALVAHFVGVF